MTPYSSVVRGIAAEAYCEAVEDARAGRRADFGVQLRWCFDIPGEAGIPAADLTLDVALRAATGRPGQLRARRPGARCATGAVRAALRNRHAPPGCTACRTQASRPARRRSGTRSTTSAPSASGTASRPRSDPELLAHLAATRTSRSRSARRRTCAPARSPSLAEHPLPALVAAGVPVTINSDDPPMFSTTLNHEYAVAADLLGLDEQGVARTRPRRRSRVVPRRRRQGGAARRDRRLPSRAPSLSAGVPIPWRERRASHPLTRLGDVP